MKRLVIAVIGLLFAFSVYAEDPIVTHKIGDDGYSRVPLQFNFPYYGKTFNDSWMYDNGIVSFLDPSKNSNAISPYSWHAQPLNQAPGSYYIATLWADMAPTNGTTYTTQGGTSYQTYNWNNIAEYYSIGSGPGLRLNTFNLKIEDSGKITTTYANVNLKTSSVTIGTVGNRDSGEIDPIAYYSNGTVINSVAGWSVNQSGDICVSQPLSNPSCPGYAQAFLAQQCSVSALYDATCPGYTQAYYTQQCNVNQLYDVNCPGYAQAYLNYQCSLDATYTPQCPGYEQAYYNKQCSINPLYDTGCTGYTEAYYNKQCSINPLYDSGCTGYAEAYLNQQCGLNPLYDSSCVGYTQAYHNQQCGINPLYDSTCTGYAQTYQQKLFNDACTANQQYNNKCPGYMVPVTVVTTNIVNTTDPIASAVTIVDPVVDNVISTPSTTSTTSISPAAVNSVVQTTTVSTTSPANVVSTAIASETKKEEKKEESKVENKDIKSEKQEQKPVSSTRAAAIESVKQKQLENAKNLANNMGQAASMKDQEIMQSVIIGAMGYVPGFDAYSYKINDAPFYKPYEVYKNQKNVDNRKSLNQLQGGGLLYQEMINEQYKEIQ
jgi:hypothetical protein